MSAFAAFLEIDSDFIVLGGGEPAKGKGGSSVICCLATQGLSLKLELDFLGITETWPTSLSVGSRVQKQGAGSKGCA